MASSDDGKYKICPPQKNSDHLLPTGLLGAHRLLSLSDLLLKDLNKLRAKTLLTRGSWHRYERS